jgi:hypothetical protein
MNLSQGVILFFAALAAGAINSVAGGGSFLSFPSLLLIGIPPVNANATSTVALWPGQPASVWAYRREMQHISKQALIPLTITGIIGGIAGAYVLLITPQTTFLHLVPWLLLAATLIFTLSGRIVEWLGRRESHPHAAFTSFHGIALQLLLAFYLGYFGAGAGILMLAMLALLGMDNIHAMNALKAWLTAVSNGVAMLLFIYHRAVYWPEAIVMVVGSVLGGYFGAYFAQKTKPSHVRLIVIVIGFGMTAYFFARQLSH